MMKTLSSVALRSAVPPGLLFLGSFVFYLALIRSFPVVYWGDAHVRLALRDQILVGHWLPLIQVLIFLVSKIDTSLLLIRTVLALMAAGVVVTTYRLGSRLFSHAAGMVAAAFLGGSILYAALATVPYPEVVFTGFVFVALEMLDRPASPARLYVGLLALNLACLTRYEGWMLAAIVIVDAAARSWSSGNWRAALPDFSRTAFVCALGPLAWLLAGVQGTGGLIDRVKAIFMFETAITDRTLESHFLSSLDLDYLRAFATNYYHLVEWQTGLWMILLGAVGFLLAVRPAQHRAAHMRILAFVGADLALLAFWQPQDFTSLRAPFIGEIFLILYAGYAFVQLTTLLLSWMTARTGIAALSNWRNPVMAGMAIVLMAASVRAAVNFVMVNSADPEFRIPAQVGEWLKGRVTENDVIWVLGDDHFRPYALGAYVQLSFDAILDDRFDEPWIRARLRSAGSVYVVALYESRDALSPLESRMLDELESGRVAALHTVVGETDVWLLEQSGSAP